jgi:hypothetical protein
LPNEKKNGHLVLWLHILDFPGQCWS